MHFVCVVRGTLVEGQVRHAVLVETADLIRGGGQKVDTIHVDWCCCIAPRKTAAEMKSEAAVGIDPGNNRIRIDSLKRDVLELKTQASFCAWSSKGNERHSIGCF